LTVDDEIFNKILSLERAVTKASIAADQAVAAHVDSKELLKELVELTRKETTQTSLSDFSLTKHSVNKELSLDVIRELIKDCD
jgi:hypothetical protein